MRHALIPLLLVLSAGHLHAQDAKAADLAALQGDWTLVMAAANGQTVEDLPSGTRHAVGDTVTVTINDLLFMRAIFTLDPSTNPRSIDYNVIAGPMEGKQVHGVYKLEGNRFTICMGAPGGSRADDFVARDGEEGSCSVWEKKE